MATTRSFKTSKGTELPLLNLKGKEYLEVKYRLVWFREEHPDWSIETELMAVTDVSAYAKATVRDEEGRIIATSHKFERIQGFPDFIEKAETGAIGRALALIGFGTQFCADELEASLERKPQTQFQAPSVAAKPAAVGRSTDTFAAKQNQADIAEASESDFTANADLGNQENRETATESADFQPGDFQINFGRKYKGKRLKDIPRSEIESYIQWLETSDVRPGTALSHQVEHLKNAFEKMYKSEEVSH